ADLEHDVREPRVALGLAQLGERGDEGALLHAEDLGEERRLGRLHVRAFEPQHERAALRHARLRQSLHQPANGEQDGDREQRPAQRSHLSSLAVLGGSPAIPPAMLRPWLATSTSPPSASPRSTSPARSSPRSSTCSPKPTSGRWKSPPCGASRRS